jgi:NADH-quinone oxidoreductase subunit L
VTNRVGDFGFLLAMFVTFGTLGTLRYTEIFSRVGQLPRVTVTAITLLLFLGAVGKSAQIPLYIWLPDAMEGPTPVSALIHAATMVTAGVYLMARVSPLLAHSPATTTTIAVIGVATALFAATLACAQNDIKKVLAYSTISQLGYMFLAVGSGAYTAAVFHMVTHAFFKALLFLGAGSVIHALHDEQDMKKMGGLRRWMPVTAGTFIVGWLAIAGVPPLAGFWSKDSILLNAYDKSPVLWAFGLATALLTAYYMTRQVYLVFFGTERWREAQSDEHGRLPHEAPWTMLSPLVVLALLSVAGGALNLPFTEKLKVLEHWLAPVFGTALREVSVSTGLEVGLAVGSAAVALLGVTAGLQLWRGRAERPELEPAVLQQAWYVDAAVSALVAGPGTAVAVVMADKVDAGLIDGAVNGVAAVVRAAGTRLRRVQTGYVRNYALGVAGGTVLLLGYVVVRAR